MNMNIFFAESALMFSEKSLDKREKYENLLDFLEESIQKNDTELFEWVAIQSCNHGSSYEDIKMYLENRLRAIKTSAKFGI